LTSSHPEVLPPTDRSWLLRTARRVALQVVPQRYHLPLRYHYRRLVGRLDQEMRYLPELVGAGRTAVDVGANVGLYTYALSRLCRRVEAFDPLAENAAAIRAFGSPRVRVHQTALSSASGTRRLYFARAGAVVDRGQGSLSATDRTDQVEVSVRRLDEFDFPQVSFMKIDVEGHELEVLKGGEATIRRWQPNLLIEIEQRHLPFPMTDVFRYVQGLGYTGWFVDTGQLAPLSRFSYDRHQQAFLGDVYAPGYVNNFVFRAPVEVP
jgi:FkbM family methyltransferase